MIRPRCPPEPDHGSSPAGPLGGSRRRAERSPWGHVGPAAVRRALALVAIGLLVSALLPLGVTAATDTDRDRLPDTFERDKSKTSPTKADTDRDGRPDWREDLDSDSLDNQYEYLAGTEPAQEGHRRRRPRDGREDADKDGLTNRYEQTSGRIPSCRHGRRRVSRRHRAPRAHRPEERGEPSGPAVEPWRLPDGHRRTGLPGLPDRQRLERPHRRSRPASNSATMINTIGLPAACTWTSVVRRLRHPHQRGRRHAPAAEVTFEYDDESDHVLYPIPASPKTEGGSDPHILMVDKDLCRLYELFARTRSGRGAPAAARRGTRARTRCAPRAGPAPTPPGSRSCPDSSATTR